MDLARANATLRPEAVDALEAWRVLVEADREQVERLSERTLGGDYYAPITDSFRPDRRPSLELPALLELARPEDVWRDIGAGGGRLAVPLAGVVQHVIAVEPSESMRAALESVAAEAGVTNVEAVPDRWPPADVATVEVVDVSLAAHSIYDIADIGPFIEALERSTRRTCVVALGDRARGGYWGEVFAAAHGESMAVLPSMREFVTVLGSLERALEVRIVPAGGSDEPVPEERAFGAARRFCWLVEGSEADARMQAFMRERYSAGEGLMRPPPLRRAVGIVRWAPPAASSGP